MYDAVPLEEICKSSVFIEIRRFMELEIHFHIHDGLEFDNILLN
jgi:hypothetical protein